MKRVIYLSFKRNDGEDIYRKYEKYIKDSDSLVSFSCGGKIACVTTTMDNIMNKGWEDDLRYEVIKSYYHQTLV